MQLAAMGASTNMVRSLSELLHRRLALPHTPHHRFHLRTFVDGAEFKFVRDRGLDHAVEKEKNLLPLMSLKNLIRSEPSRSLPLSTIADSKEKLRLPIRPIEFVRRYPTVFEEYFPGNVRIHPHVKLTQDALDLDSEEQLIYQSDAFRRGAANRLLKLLMLCRVNEIPLGLIDRLKWDLGIPDDYMSTLVPEFPDYFQMKRVKGSGNPGRSNEALLELVCWDGELATSAMEKKAIKADSGYKKGMPIQFPLQFSKGFEMDKGLKKWIDDWQKLPYFSPYEDVSNLQSKSDESDRWVVGVLHELLHIFISKKTERDNLHCLGEYLGIRSRFKRALMQHPGIFYLSSKAGTYTVVLREGFKRGLLNERHPLMELRNRYVHLMNKGKEVEKPATVPSVKKKQSLKGPEVEKEANEDAKEDEDEMQFSEDESEQDDEDDVKDDIKRPAYKTASTVGRRKHGNHKKSKKDPRKRPGKGRRLNEAF